LHVSECNLSIYGEDIAVDYMEKVQIIAILIIDWLEGEINSY